MTSEPTPPTVLRLDRAVFDLIPESQQLKYADYEAFLNSMGLSYDFKQHRSLDSGPYSYTIINHRKLTLARLRHGF
jgi:hypothetical protein